jgi:hypothetical protein
MGVLIDKTADFELLKAPGKAMSIRQIGNKGYIERRIIKANSRHDHGLRADSNGLRLRCRVDIKYNLSKPLCRECYEEWAAWGMKSSEQFCHSCGHMQMLR